MKGKDMNNLKKVQEEYNQPVMNEKEVTKMKQRMEEAKKLLLQTDYKSHAIGAMVGYPEPNYFSYVFKKNCGMSPAKYRKLEGAEHEK